MAGAGKHAVEEDKGAEGGEGEAGAGDQGEDGAVGGEEGGDPEPEEEGGEIAGAGEHKAEVEE